MLVSLIIPTLNEKDALKFLFEELKEAILSISYYQFELIIVDDDSTDGTREFVKSVRLPWPIKLIERNERGLATAVLQGFKNANGDILGVMDADLSHPPEIIKKMLKEIEDADLIIGSRHIAGGGVEAWPLVRKLFSKFATLLAYPLAKGVTDPLSGFFFIKKSALCTNLTPVGYKILLEILVKCAPKKIIELPYVFRNRSVGKSKLNWRVTLDYFLHLIRLYKFKLKI